MVRDCLLSALLGQGNTLVTKMLCNWKAHLLAAQPTQTWCPNPRAVTVVLKGQDADRHRGVEVSSYNTNESWRCKVQRGHYSESCCIACLKAAERANLKSARPKRDLVAGCDDGGVGEPYITVSQHRSVSVSASGAVSGRRALASDIPIKPGKVILTIHVSFTFFIKGQLAIVFPLFTGQYN